MTLMRLSTINKAAVKEGLGLELVKGNGYFYVAGPGTEHLDSASIYVYRLADQDQESWLKDMRSFAKEIKEYSDRADPRA